MRTPWQRSMELVPLRAVAALASVAIAAGASTWQADPKVPQSIFRVRSFWTHPEWDNPPSSHDVAFVRVGKPLTHPARFANEDPVVPGCDALSISYGTDEKGAGGNRKAVKMCVETEQDRQAAQVPVPLPGSRRAAARSAPIP
jgi:hypothetical protein